MGILEALSAAASLGGLGLSIFGASEAKKEAKKAKKEAEKQAEENRRREILTNAVNKLTDGRGDPAGIIAANGRENNAKFNAEQQYRAAQAAMAPMYGNIASSAGSFFGALDKGFNKKKEEPKLHTEDLPDPNSIPKLQSPAAQTGQLTYNDIQPDQYRWMQGALSGGQSQQDPWDYLRGLRL